MTLATTYSRAGDSIAAPLISIEVHLSNGLPGLSIVGLPETAVRESKDRVRAALLNSRFEFPARRITINLAPADLPKEGGRFDLAIAIGILAASGQIPTTLLNQHEFIAELALSGELRPVYGILPAAMQTRQAGRALVTAVTNAGEAARIGALRVHGAGHLLAVCAHLCGQTPLERTPAPAFSAAPSPAGDLGDVRGQPHARRALEIAAAGAHSLLLYGPPGSGKSMLASRLASILPPMTETEALETAMITSLRGNPLSAETWQQRPVRAPHHTTSAVALVGGGSRPRPGEVSLAHNGVLFLDELPEFERRALEGLREPLETGQVNISRAARQAIFPARVQLVAAMNPCPCGYLGDHSGRCHCTPEQVQRYRARLSGPLMDRIDMHIEVPRVPYAMLHGKQTRAETSSEVRQRVMAARATQLTRQGVANQRLPPQQTQSLCALDDAGHALLETAVERLGLSARAYTRILRVARTIADLAAAESITPTHLGEAITYRQLDRKGVGDN